MSVFLIQSGVYIFESTQYIYYFTSLNVYVIPCDFFCLTSGKFTPSSHPGKILKY